MACRVVTSHVVTSHKPLGVHIENMTEDPFGIFGSNPDPDWEGDEVPEPGRVIYQIEESRTGSAYQAVCPELLITAFGDTAQDARDGLRQRVADYLEDCDNLGVLDETLIEAGFYFDDGMWISSEVKPVDGPDILIL